MSTVYFTDMRARKGHGLLDKVEQLFFEAGLQKIIDPGDLVAIKLHFGERGNTGFLRPQFARRVVDKVKQTGGKPFLTDANTLYVGTRSNAVDHLRTAIENGFDFAVVDAPLVIADGINGKDYVKVPVNLRHFQEVNIGSGVYHADSLIALTHFKGHETVGFGGVLKNIGMGLGSRSGKQQMHSDILPGIDAEKCHACGKCCRWCPGQAITMDKIAVINEENCLGCGECTATCPNGAIRINWKTRPDIIQEKICEYTYGVLKDKKDKAGFITFVMNVTPECDCPGWSDAPLVPDIGILASTDPIAIDQCAYDLVCEAQGLTGTKLDPAQPQRDKFFAIHGVDGTLQLEYGERIGLGSRNYQLKII